MPDSLFDRNIEAMLPRYEQEVSLLLKGIQNINMIEEEQDIIPFVEDVCGKKVLAVQKKDKVYRMDSLYDSKPMLDLWFSGLKDKWDLNSKLYMYGLGNGMFARKFLLEARQDCKIFVHEPSYKIFKTVLENYDLTDLFSNERFVFIFWPRYVGYYVKSVYEKIMDYTDVASLAGSNYPNYVQLFPKDCASYVENMERVRSFASANQSVNDFFGAYFSKNVFSNMSLLLDSYDIASLADQIPEELTAIVVAAGPSLDKNIREIAKAKGRSIIISTDTALKPLSLAGIVPDITAILDGKKDERYLSQEDSRKIPIVCTPRGGTEFLHLHTGKKFFINDYCDHINDFLKSIGRGMVKLDAGGSVACACFAIARLFHCKKIILVGQDLAYTGDKTHSSVTVRGARKTEVDELEHVIMDVDIYGNPIRSSKEFRLYKEWYEQRINADKSLEVIDATEGGIKIEGTIIKPLKQAIEEYCIKEFDFSKAVEQAQYLLDIEARKKYSAFVRNIPTEIMEIRGIIRSTIADYSAMRRLVQSNNYHNSKMKKLFDNCRRRTREIENCPAVEYIQVQLQGKSTELLDKVNKLEDDERQELLTTCDLGEQYLRDMDQAITELEPYMEVIKRDFE